MRKRLKLKRRSCKMCKPHKMGLARRWKNREESSRVEFEKQAEKIKKTGGYHEI